MISISQIEHAVYLDSMFSFENDRSYESLFMVLYFLQLSIPRSHPRRMLEMQPQQKDEINAYFSFIVLTIIIVG